MQPVLKAFLTCDRVKRADKGNYGVEGIFGQVFSKKYPLKVPLQCFLTWSNLEEKDHKGEIRIHVPKEKNHRKLPFEIKNVEYNRYNYNTASERTVIDIPGPGDVEFEVVLDGESYGKYNMPAFQREILEF